jgi:hypothetical protein
MGDHDYNQVVRVSGAVLAAVTLVANHAAAGNLKLLVFLHVSVKQRALQSELQGALPGIDVTTVGRVGDWERAIKEGTDAVIALATVLREYKFNPTLRGQRGGSTEEKYALVGVGAVPDPTKVMTVGALDLLGRDGTTRFVKDIMGASPKVERVSKVEDLLPLLQMQRADAILLPERLFVDVRNASKLPLASKELGKGVGLPAAANVTPAGAQVLGAVGKLSTKVSKTLGVDSWR